MAFPLVLTSRDAGNEVVCDCDVGLIFRQSLFSGILRVGCREALGHSSEISEPAWPTRVTIALARVGR